MTAVPADLETLWHKRLKDAQLQLDFARTYLKEVERDLKSGCLPSPDGDLAHRNALHAENLALQKVARLRKIFKDLVACGKVPDEQFRRRATMMYQCSDPVRLETAIRSPDSPPKPQEPCITSVTAARREDHAQ